MIGEQSNMLNEMICQIQETYPLIQGKVINPKKIVFEERVKMNCFYCGRYGNNWRCPPHIPDVDYKKMIMEYENCAFIYVAMPLGENGYKMIRTESSVYLHRALLMCEKWLYEHNKSTALAFIGGSCKLCKNGCMAEHCANPYESRSPVEALGINVVKSAAKVGIDVKFPVTERMMRIGLLLW